MCNEELERLEEISLLIELLELTASEDIEIFSDEDDIMSMLEDISSIGYSTAVAFLLSQPITIIIIKIIKTIFFIINPFKSRM